MGICIRAGHNRSLASRVGIVLAGCVVATSAIASAQQTRTSYLPSISVTASPMAAPLSHSMHSVTVLDRKAIRKSPATNLAQLLASINGVTVRRRGAPGVQADISIRGSSFKQTQILVDGVPMQSPQAAHLNANIPIPLSAIKRIEVVKGPGAISYGGNGNGGIINIITRRASKTEAGVDLAAGSHATRRINAHIGTGNRRLSSLLTVHASHNDSENPDRPTNADIRQVLYTGDAQLAALHLKWGVNASRKKYGAWGFYSDTFPHAHEKTDVQTVWLNASLHPGQWILHGRVYWGRQTDNFLTLINNAGFLNRHKTHADGFEADLQRTDSWGTTIAGGKFRYAAMDSSALGVHHRHHNTFWLFRQQRLTDHLSAELGINHTSYSEYDNQWLPSVSLAWQFNADWRAYASWARSARAPTYTELYLSTPANQGNPDLGIEKSQSYELGLTGRFHAQQLDVGVFKSRPHPIN